MAWRYTDLTPSEVIHDGIHYEVRDMGGDGNCLFLSLALVFAMAGAPQRSHVELRAMTVKTLQHWLECGVPLWFDRVAYEAPTQKRIEELNGGGWGDLTCMLALLATTYPNYCIKVLNASAPTLQDEWSLAGPEYVRGDPIHKVLVLWCDFCHYVALVPKDKQETLERTRASLVAMAPAVSSNVISAKLSTVSSLSRMQNTINQSSLSLEIHQIDVGIGDAALVLVKDQGSYVQSILVDCGKSHEVITAYFDDLIKQGRFRPVDVFIASHYDNDHIGAAYKVLKDERYASKEILLYDSGNPTHPSRDYEGYKNAFGEPNVKPRQIPDLEEPIYKHKSVTVRVVAMNGLYCSKSAGSYTSANEAIEGEIAKKFVEGGVTKNEWVYAGLDPNLLFPEDTNDCSLAVLVEFGYFHYFTAGDLNGEIEDQVAFHVFDRYLGKKGAHHVCACKLSHHGAHEASRPALLRYFRPRVCLVSCGTPNTYGHPSSVTVDRVVQLNKVYESTLLVTADLEEPASGQGSPWARPPLAANVRHRQGSIVVWADEYMVRNERHGFVVLSSATPKPTLYLCGQREYRANLAIVDRQEKPKRSEASKAASADRKRTRAEQAKTERAKALESLRGTLSDGLMKSIKEAADTNVVTPEQRDELRAQVLAELDALTQRLSEYDENVRSKKVNTVVRNFGNCIKLKEFPEPAAAGKFLRKSR